MSKDVPFWIFYVDFFLFVSLFKVVLCKSFPSIVLFSCQLTDVAKTECNTQLVLIFYTGLYSLSSFAISVSFFALDNMRIKLFAFYMFVTV